MKAISVNFWHGCSNDCIFCFCKEADLLSEKLDPGCITSPLEIGRALLKNQKECDWLIISGNEPTLNPDLLITVKLAKKIGYKVDLRTNGRSLKNISFCRKLFKVGVDRINITLLDSKAVTHDFLSGSKGAFSETVLGIGNVLSMWKPDQICVYNVVTKYNYRKLSKSVRFYYQLGIRDIQFNFVYHTDLKIVPKLADLEKHLQEAIKEAMELGINTRVYGFPLCVLGKYPDISSELSTNNEVVLGGRISDYEKVRISLGKAKSEYCKTCKLSDICEGTWKSYFKIHGEDEFEFFSKRTEEKTVLKTRK